MRLKISPSPGLNSPPPKAPKTYKTYIGQIFGGTFIATPLSRTVPNSQQRWIITWKKGQEQAEFKSIVHFQGQFGPSQLQDRGYVKKDIDQWITMQTAPQWSSRALQVIEKVTKKPKPKATTTWWWPIDTGVTDVTPGLRDDGKPLGYGCGDAKTDAIIPDKLFGHDLTPACVQHDANYLNCNMIKSDADARLRHDVKVAMGGEDWASELASKATSRLYYLAVRHFGQSAYEQSQSDAGCKAGRR